MKKNKLLLTLIPLFSTPFLAISCKCEKKTKDENLEQIISKANIEVSNEYKNNHTSNEAINDSNFKSLININNIDKNKYETSILSIKKHNETSIELTIQLKSKATNKTISKKFIVDGFKKENTIDHQKLINEEAKKIITKYTKPNPGNTEAKDVKFEDFEFSGFDKEKYEISKEKTRLDASNSKNGILNVYPVLKTKDGKYFSKPLTLPHDFKFFKKKDLKQEKINSLLNEVDSLEYSGSSNIYSKDANDPTRITWKFHPSVYGESEDDYELIVEEIKLNEENYNEILVKYRLKDKINNLISQNTRTKTISGFKSMPESKIEIEKIKTEIRNYFANAINKILSDPLISEYQKNKYRDNAKKQNFIKYATELISAYSWRNLEFFYEDDEAFINAYRNILKGLLENALNTEKLIPEIIRNFSNKLFDNKEWKKLYKEQFIKWLLQYKNFEQEKNKLGIDIESILKNNLEYLWNLSRISDIENILVNKKTNPKVLNELTEEIKNKCREKFSTLLNDSDRLPDSSYPELKDIKKIIIEFYLDSAIYYAKNKVAFDNLVSKIKPY